MSLANASGAPSYSDSPSGTRTFIPEVWSGKLIEKFYDATVLAAISNTDYEGEIKKFGDKVKIRTVPTAAIRDYTRNTDISYDMPDGDVIDLEIDKGKYYAAQIDDVSAYQQDVKVMDKWATDASEQMKIAIDTDVLAATYTQVDSHNKGATAGRIASNLNMGTSAAPRSVSSTTILDAIVDAGQVLDEQNIPEQGRFLIVPAWALSRIKKSDLKDASLTGDGQSILRNGRVGMIDRFTLYLSNLLPSATVNLGTSGAPNNVKAFHLLAGHKNGLTFASQMTEMEKLRLEKRFADAVRGLQVYGYKVIDPTCLVDLYAYAA
ncbi:phage major capsid protein [Candidimonas nitroreducens]|uniref:P22 coat protein-protein 5 domain protein n=1 Tax=Candidimonas nitroreducens TaxID=683354 RepID=A0A225M2B7_9BURK|nr:hypothetical protein [Candidimonas nitroreducens]OWT55266.1 hypothetical protein CEY11_21385 [Candidimonas nitroreducens]